jgi:hypothetical protein
MPLMARPMTTAANALASRARAVMRVRSVKASHRATTDAPTAISTEAANSQGS